MRLLLDTCVLSELRLPDPHNALLRLMRSVLQTDVYLSVIVMAEAAMGIALLNDGRKKDALESWLLATRQSYAERILPVDLETAEIWAEMRSRNTQKGRTLPVIDALIAATALRHGLTLVTRNSRDFVSTGAMVIDPWAN